MKWGSNPLTLNSPIGLTGGSAVWRHRVARKLLRYPPFRACSSKEEQRTHNPLVEMSEFSVRTILVPTPRSARTSTRNRELRRLRCRRNLHLFLLFHLTPATQSGYGIRVHSHFPFCRGARRPVPRCNRPDESPLWSSPVPGSYFSAMASDDGYFFNP